ncbi:MAG: DUF5702 domain-containing protein [Peptococcaceae bacterium]|nr:DUF5702 domain-containing protein [Peptococcaceae bacterium]
MFNFINKCKGSISIFLTLVMLPMFVGAGFVIDGARMSAAKTHVSGAGDLAMNAALSEYDDMLKDIYGLFAMSKSVDELQKNIEVYFNNTINNTGVLDSGDSYTRGFINSIASMFSTDEISFENIVDTRSQSFSAQEVPASALANPNVLEAQIVEYMKYRGPFNIASGFLDKIKVFSETNKQNQAINKKIEYDKQLNKVQDCLEEAYKAINAYNSLTVGSWSNKTELTNHIGAVMDNAKKEYTLMTEYIIACNDTRLRVNALAEDKTLRKAIEDEIDAKVAGYVTTPTETDKFLLAMNKLKDLDHIEAKPSGTVLINGLNDKFYQRAVDKLKLLPKNTLEEQIAYILYIRDHAYPTYREVYTLINILDTYYKNMTAEEKQDYKKYYDFYIAFRTTITEQVNTAVNLPTGWQDQANAHGLEGSKTINSIDSYAKEISDKLETAVKALDNAIKQINAADGAREQWKTSIGGLSETDIKATMQSDYENSAKNLDKESVETLKKALTDSKLFFDEITGMMDAITYYGQKVNDKNYPATNFYNRFKNNIGNSEIIVPTGAGTLANDCMDKNYVNPSIDRLTSKSFAKIDETTDEFYKYLKNLFAHEGEDSGEGQGVRDLLINTGNASDLGAGDNPVTGGAFSSFVDPAIIGEINALFNGAGTITPYVQDQATTGKNDEENAQKGQNNINFMTNLLGGLEKLLKNERDIILLEEYITEMFSCHTSDRDTEGKEISDPKALNGKSLKDNAALFGGEIEYILWGDDNSETNIAYTKGLLFGLRFLLNCIYAFTSSEVRVPSLAMATAIAGWTGFGVPLVQTVIILAWAAAESALDVYDLGQGKPVAIYKSTMTWKLSARGGVNALKDEIAKGVKATASQKIDDIFEKINNFAAEEIEGARIHVQDYIDNSIQGVAETAIGAILTPLQELILSTVPDQYLTRQQIEDKVDSYFESLMKSSEGDDLTSKAKRTAISIIQAQYSQQIIDTIEECHNMFTSGAVEAAITEKVTELVNGIEGRIRGEIRVLLQDAGDELVDAFNEISGEASNLAKEKLTDAIDKFSDKLTPKTGGANIGKPGKISTASAVTLTYHEYLKLFVLLFMHANKDAMLSRTATLIQANMKNVGNSSFNISQAHTMIKVNAVVDIKTTFFNVPIFITGVDSDGRTTYNMDFSGIGSGRQTLSYIGVNGY